MVTFNGGKGEQAMTAEVGGGPLLMLLRHAHSLENEIVGQFKAELKKDAKGEKGSKKMNKKPVGEKIVILLGRFSFLRVCFAEVEFSI